MVLLISLTMVLPAQARKTRDLVFEDEEQPKAAQSSPERASKVVAVKTAVELERNGQKSTVLPTYTFQNGDKVKFIYTTNVDAYVYWISQGTSGSYYMLFPNPKVGMDNYIKKNAVHTIPVKGSFKFSGKPGAEKILLVMSPEKIPELEQAAQEAAVKGGRIKDQSGQVNSVGNKSRSKRKSRDLVFEEEEDESSGVATSSQVSNDISEPMVVYYELKHR